MIRVEFGFEDPGREAMDLLLQGHVEGRQVHPVEGGGSYEGRDLAGDLREEAGRGAPFFPAAWAAGGSAANAAVQICSWTAMRCPVRSRNR